MAKRVVDLNPEADRMLASVAGVCNGDADRALLELLIAHESIETFLNEFEAAHAADLIRQRDSAQADFGKGLGVPWEIVKCENGL
jgi:hypothetical protein